VTALPAALFDAQISKIEDACSRADNRGIPLGLVLETLELKARIRASEWPTLGVEHLFR
jgi:hypothetical protein